MISLVNNLFSSWKKTLWDKIDTEILLEETKKLQKRVAQMPKEVTE